MWKTEPVSPSGSLKTEYEDDWVLFDDKPVALTNHAAEPDMYKDQPTRAQVATKLLEELDEWIKEEPFSDWLEEKIDLPIFEELPVPESGQNKPTIYTGVPKSVEQEDTQTLLQEFETVLGDVEACHQIVPTVSTTLTPPQSPPAHKPPVTVDTRLLVTLQPVQPLFPVGDQQPTIYNVVLPPADRTYGVGVGIAVQEQSSVPVAGGSCSNGAGAGDTGEVWNGGNLTAAPVQTTPPPPPSQLGSDVASDFAVVDEYVRSHTEDVPPLSPCTSSGGSYVSSEDSVDDPDWTIEAEHSATGERIGKHASAFASVRSRHKPYSRPTVEDKKVRKKEQNKNAATRYRQKKKQEIKEILGEERELTEHNERLQNQVKDLQREIGYLKSLMRDLFRAKGLIK